MIAIKDYIYAGLIVALIAGGVWYHHKVLDEGIAEQVAKDTTASNALKAETAKQTADLEARAVTAEQAYDKERADNQNYIDSHPVQPVRLCLSTAPGRSVVPQAGAIKPGNASSGAGPQSVQSVPTGDSSGGGGTAGPDISNLLSLLAAKADTVSAELREFQSR
jgi:hypothetical protein